MSHHSIVAKFLQNYTGRENDDLPLTQEDVGNFQALLGYKFCVPYQISAEAIGDLAKLPTQASTWVQEVAEMEVPVVASALVVEDAVDTEDSLEVTQQLDVEEPKAGDLEDQVTGTEEVQQPADEVFTEEVAEETNEAAGSAEDNGEEEDNA